MRAPLATSISSRRGQGASRADRTLRTIDSYDEYGLPGTSNFVGEFLSLAGTYQVSTTITLLCTTGIILGAAYMLYLYRRVVFGELTKDDVRAMPDLSPRR